jgi:hypothetical protein
MTYLAQKLITRSWYLSGIIARNLQTPTFDQINDGLMMLNDLLNFKQIETDLIPYWTYIQIPLVANQEFYYLPNVADIESSTFNIGPVRYPMVETSRKRYFASSRVDNISTLPFNWNFNRGEGGGTLALYFLPASNYPQKMMVKFFLNDVGLQDDLTNIFSDLATGFVSTITITNPGNGYTHIPTVTIDPPPIGGTQAEAFATVQNGNVTSINITNSGSGYTTTPNVVITGNGSSAVAVAALSNYTFLQTNNAGFDTSYIEYLRYALAQYMCSEYGILFNPESSGILRKMERKLMYMSPPDLSRDGISILGEGQGYNWGDVNIGKGYRP